MKLETSIYKINTGSEYITLPTLSSAVLKTELHQAYLDVAICI